MTKIPSVEEYSKAYEERSFERMSELAMRLVERNETQRLALLTELTQTIQAIDFYGWNEQTQSKIKEKVQAHLDELINSSRLELNNP